MNPSATRQTVSRPMSGRREVSFPFWFTRRRADDLILVASMSMQERAGSSQQHVQGYIVQEHIVQSSLISLLAPCCCIEIEDKKNRDICPLRVVRNGSETAGRTSDGRMLVGGVVEGLGNGEDVRFGLPGQNPNTPRCQISSGGREEKRTSLLFPHPPRRPCKGDQTRFGGMFLKRRIFNLLD